MSTLSDDDLLERLTAALRPPTISPDRSAYALLHSALATRSAATSPARNRTRFRRNMASRPIAGAMALTILASGGAAAAVGADALPGPVRAVAFSLGLPVTSPDLENARAALAALQQAVDTRDRAGIRADLTWLHAAMKPLSVSETTQLDPEASQLIAKAQALLAAATEVAGAQAPRPGVITPGASAPAAPFSAQSDRGGSAAPSGGVATSGGGVPAGVTDSNGGADQEAGSSVGAGVSDDQPDGSSTGAPSSGFGAPSTGSDGDSTPVPTGRGTQSSGDTTSSGGNGASDTDGADGTSPEQNSAPTLSSSSDGGAIDGSSSGDGG